MLRRTRWFRLLATFVAVWLPLTVGEPAALSLCAAHHGVAAAADAGSHHGHGGASSQSADAAGHHAPASGSGHQHCTCIGGCSASTATIAVPDVPIATIVVVALETSGYSATAPSRALPSPDFVRPHTTGPPRA